MEGDKPAKKRFKSNLIGDFHVGIAEGQAVEGKHYLFVAIDRTTKFALTERPPSADKMTAAQLLRHVIEALPYPLHTVLTDHGIPFANRSSDQYAFPHIFGRVYEEQGIEHRLTKVKHPRTNGQVEQMNQTIKDATCPAFSP